MIHDTPLTTFIQYGENDSRKFYDKKPKNDKGSSIETRLLV